MPLVLQTRTQINKLPKTVPNWVLKAVNARYFIESPNQDTSDWGVPIGMVDRLADLLASGSQSALDDMRTITDYLTKKMQERAQSAGSQSLNVLNAQSRERATTISPGLDNNTLRDRVSHIAREDVLGIVGNSVQASTYLNGLPWMREYGLSQAEIAGLTPQSARTLNNRVLSWRDAGLSAADIRKDIISYAESSRLDRAEAIVRTELSRAENDAFQAQMEYASNNELSGHNVMRVWITARDERTCPQCAPLDNMIIGINDSLENPVTFESVRYPPLHPRCRCYIAITITPADETGIKPRPPTPIQPPLTGVPPGKTWEDQAAYAARLDPSIKVSVSTAINLPDYYYVGHDGLLYKANELDKYGIKADTLFSGKPVANVRVLKNKELLIQLTENATPEQLNAIRRMIATSKSPFQAFVWDAKGKPSPIITTLEALLKHFKKEPTEHERKEIEREKKEEKEKKEHGGKEKSELEKELEEELKKEQEKEDKDLERMQELADQIEEERERQHPTPPEPTPEPPIPSEPPTLPVITPVGVRELIYEPQSWEKTVRDAIKTNPTAIMDEDSILARPRTASYIMDTSGQMYALDRLRDRSGITYNDIRPDGVNSSVAINVSPARVSVYVSVNISAEQMKALESLLTALNRRTMVSVVDTNGSTTDYNTVAEAKLHIALSSAPLPIRRVPPVPIPEPPIIPPEPLIPSITTPEPTIPWETNAINSGVTPFRPNERFTPQSGETYVMAVDGTMYRMSEIYRVGEPALLPNQSGTAGYIELTYNTAADRLTISTSNMISREQFDNLSRAIGNIPQSNVYWRVHDANSTVLYAGYNENAALNHIIAANRSTISPVPPPSPIPTPVVAPTSFIPPTGYYNAENWQSSYQIEAVRHPNLQQTIQQALDARDYALIDGRGQIYNPNIADSIGLPSGLEIIGHQGVQASIGSNWINFAVNHDITEAQINAISEMINTLTARRSTPPQIEISIVDRSGQFRPDSATTIAELRAELAGIRNIPTPTPPIPTSTPTPTPPGTTSPLLGIDTIDKARNIWDGTFGGLQSKVTTFEVQTSGGSKTIEIYGDVLDSSGYSAGSWHRTLYPDTGEVHHSLLSLKDTYQGNNFATEFNNKAFAEYKAAGYTHVTVFANIDVGGYTWAKQGFDFASSSQITRYIDKLDAYRKSREYKTKFTPEQRRQYEDELEKLEIKEKDRNQHISAFDISQFGKSWMAWTQPASSYGPATDIQMWPGKSIMLGTNWDGIMQL